MLPGREDVPAAGVAALAREELSQQGELRSRHAALLIAALVDVEADAPVGFGEVAEVRAPRHHPAAPRLQLRGGSMLARQGSLQRLREARDQRRRKSHHVETTRG